MFSLFISFIGKLINIQIIFTIYITLNRFESGSSIIRHPSSVAYLLSNDSLSCRTSLDKMSKVIQWISFSKHEIHPFLQGALLQPGLTRDGRFQVRLKDCNCLCFNNEFQPGFK